MIGMIMLNGNKKTRNLLGFLMIWVGLVLGPTQIIGFGQTSGPATNIRVFASDPTGNPCSQTSVGIYSGVLYLCSGGVYAASGGGGTTINPTNGQVPYRVNSTTFGDSAISSNALNATGISVTSAAAGSGVTITATSSGSNENLTISPKGTGSLLLNGPLTNSTNSFLHDATSFNWKLWNAGQFTWSSSVSAASAADTGLARLSAGVARITNGSTGASQLLVGTSTDTADAQLSVYSQSTTRPGLKLRALSGTSSSQAALESYNAAGSLTFSVNATGGFIAEGNSRIADAAFFYWTTRATLSSPADSVLRLANNADTQAVLLAVDGASNTLAQRNSTNAQTFRVYGTYTDASNYRRAALYELGNYFYLTAENLGTGAARGLVVNSLGPTAGALTIGLQGGVPLIFGNNSANFWQFNASGHFLAMTDNTYDIGASGATRPRDIHIARSANTVNLVLGGNTTLSAATGAGIVMLSNTGGTDFNRLQFGGTSSSFPALKRSSAELQVVLADDTGFAATQSLYIRYGSGTPEGAVTAPVGAIYSRTDGGAGTSFYVKESGSGNTGWIAK